MPFKQLPPDRLDEALRRQPLWQPPPGFARAVAARVPAVARQWPAVERRRGAALFRAAAAGLATAAATYVVGSLLMWGAPFTVTGAATAADRYVMFIELATGALIANMTVVALISVAGSLSLVVAVMRRSYSFNLFSRI